jgi:hypothetical protein
LSVVKFGPVQAQFIKDSVSNAVVEQITSTAETTVYGFQIDNRNNKAASTTRFWFKSSAPTIGTHDPQLVIKTPAGSRQSIQLGGAALAGKTVSAANFLYVNTTTLAGSPSTVSPVNDVLLSIATSTT